MNVLTSPTEIFNLDQPIPKLVDNKICVYDCSNKDDQDFYLKKITTFISYKYPTVTIKVGDKHKIELPLNWKILIADDYDRICKMIPVEDLLHYENKIVMFSPYHPGLPKLLKGDILSINPHSIEHFVPKLPKKNILALPIGNKNIWDTKVYNYFNDSIDIYPDCIYACDDIDSSKIEFNLYDMI